MDITIMTSTPAISRAEIAETLAKIRAITAQTKIPTLNPNALKSTSHFDGVLSAAKESLSALNAIQNNTESLKTAYLKGDTKVSLPQVLLSSIQSKVAFEGLLVVQKKLIESYKEIMNMPM